MSSWRAAARPPTQTYQPLITDPAFQRREANTYLTYPEWHIVFAYDGLAQALKTGDEHAFDYVDSISSFWSSTCALTRVAGRHGGADWDTRSMIHTIGVSFTAEMLAKAAYEETLGRATAWLRGPRKTPQDAVDRRRGRRLRGVPAPDAVVPVSVQREGARALGAACRAVASRMGAASRHRPGVRGEGASMRRSLPARSPPRRRRSWSSAASSQDSTRRRSRAWPVSRSIGRRGDGIEIETPRYDLFTRILADIARQGGAIREIAGNDEIMVSMTVREGGAAPVSHGTVILRMKRDGIPGERLLVNVRMADLAAFLNTYPLGDPGLEHVFDY